MKKYIFSALILFCFFVQTIIKADDTQQPYVWIVSEATWIKNVENNDVLYLVVDAYTGQQITHIDVEVWNPDIAKWVHMFHPNIPLGDETTMQLVLALGPFTPDRKNYWIRIFQTPGLGGKDHDPLGDTAQPIHSDMIYIPVGEM